MKKLFVIFMSLIFIICLVGCKNDELNEYKMQKNNELDKYVNSKTVEQYSSLSIEKINLICIDGKK